MVYVTICKECLADDHERCGESHLIPERKRIADWNVENPSEDIMVGGGHCLCGHGEEENEFTKSVRANAERRD